MKNVAIHRSYEPGVTVHIAPQELRQIATNLISNALDASSPPNARVSIQIGREENSAVLLVEDNGSGISEAHLHRIFDPFFTTKDDTGTGIGLWVTRELVEKAGGTISVKSGELPGGAKTSFRIAFPLSAAPVAGASVESNQPAVS
jgi:signal transduction histidine kinase